MKPSNKFLWGGLITALIICFAAACGQDTADKPPRPNAGMITIRGRTMGTTYSVKIVTEAAEGKAAHIKKGIDVLLKTVNMTDWFNVSADTVLVFSESQRISALSGGAFDITVGPLINLWGFGAAKQERTVPPQEKLKETMAQTGYGKLAVRTNPPALKKEAPRLYCSLAGIAKGFGVDKTALHLESLGYMNYMVEIGGEIRCRGAKPGKKPWRLAIEKPDGSRSFQLVLELVNTAMATSGDYHNYFEKDGVRYSHTIDPTTGRPITHKLASVTVLHPSCMTADGLATAINVLGPGKGYDLVLKENLAVFMIIREGDGFIEKKSPAFREIQEGNKEI
jgi:thiamine biosynthesis lipoprotein